MSWLFYSIFHYQILPFYLSCHGCYHFLERLLPASLPARALSPKRTYWDFHFWLRLCPTTQADCLRKQEFISIKKVCGSYPWASWLPLNCLLTASCWVEFWRQVGPQFIALDVHYVLLFKVLWKGQFDLGGFFPMVVLSQQSLETAWTCLHHKGAVDAHREQSQGSLLVFSLNSSQITLHTVQTLMSHTWYQQSC